MAIDDAYGHISFLFFCNEHTFKVCLMQLHRRSCIKQMQLLDGHLLQKTSRIFAIRQIEVPADANQHWSRSASVTAR